MFSVVLNLSCTVYVLVTLCISPLLSGYCDPQTLFMLGEDSNTCMGIRARQKGSNRGLLSMLLHGNCRILGKKDSNGRLTARAVSRLLVDDATGLPVLYVETPYGSVDEDSYVAVSPWHLHLYLIIMSSLSMCTVTE